MSHIVDIQADESWKIGREKSRLMQNHLPLRTSQLEFFKTLRLQYEQAKSGTPKTRYYIIATLFGSIVDYGVLLGDNPERMPRTYHRYVALVCLGQHPGRQNIDG